MPPVCLYNLRDAVPATAHVSDVSNVARTTDALHKATAFQVKHISCEIVGELVAKSLVRQEATNAIDS
jgi:hypothetical protein